MFDIHGTLQVQQASELSLPAMKSIHVSARPHINNISTASTYVEDGGLLSDCIVNEQIVVDRTRFERKLLV